MHEQKNKPTIFTLKDQILLSMINNDKMNIEMKCDMENQEDTTDSKKCLMRVCCNLNERLKGYIDKVNSVEELWLRLESKQNEIKYDNMLKENRMKELFKYDLDVGSLNESKSSNLLPFLQQANENLFTYHNECKRYPLDLTDFNKFMINYKRRHDNRTRCIKELKRENMRLKAYSRDLYERLKSVTGKSEFNYESFTTDSNFESVKVENNKNESIECNNSLASFSEEGIYNLNELNNYKNNYNLGTIYDQNQPLSKSNIKMDTTNNTKMKISILKNHLMALKSSEKDSGFQPSTSCQHHQNSDDNLTDNCEHLSTCVDNEANTIVNKETIMEKILMENQEKNSNEFCEILERKIKARENVNFNLLSEILAIKNQLTESEKGIKERNIRLFYMQNQLEENADTIYKLNNEIETINETIKMNFNKSSNCELANCNQSFNEKEGSLQYMVNDFIHHHNVLKMELESKSRIITEMEEITEQINVNHARSIDALKSQLSESSLTLLTKNQLEKELALLKKEHEVLLLKYSESHKQSLDYKLKFENDLKMICDYEAEIKFLKEEISLTKEQHETNIKALSEVSNLHKKNFETTLESLNVSELKNKNLEDCVSKLNIDNENLKELVFKLNNDNSYLNTQLNKFHYDSLSTHLDLSKIKTDLELLSAENEDLRKKKKVPTATLR